MGPFLVENAVSGLRDISAKDAVRSGTALGLQFLGWEDVLFTSETFPTRMWKPRVMRSTMQHESQPDETWAMIAVSAATADDKPYAKLARSISISLVAAGLHLRALSDEYNKQLMVALEQRRPANTRYGDLSLIGLHLACHSLVAEMSSARDYLAQIAARRCAAPLRVDSLAKLVEWSQKPSNAAAASDDLVKVLSDPWDKSAVDPWLWDITDYRNRFLHREPLTMEEGARYIVLREHTTPTVIVRTMNMEITLRDGSDQTGDALVRFADLCGRLFVLADVAATFAKYKPKRLLFKADSHQGICSDTSGTDT